MLPMEKLGLPSFLQNAIAVPLDAYPKTQNALPNPEKWNSDWEEIYQTNSFLFDPKITIVQRSILKQANRGGSSISPQDAQDYVVLHDSTCEIQHRIAINFIDATTRQDFEKRWLDASVVDRRRHALRSLSNAGSLARNLNEGRAYCFDILRLDYLSQDGHVLLDLLKAIMPDDLDLSAPPKTPYYFPEPNWDSLRAEYENSSNEVEKYAYKEVLILRTKLIWTMKSFLDQPLPSVTVLKQRDSRTAFEKKDAARNLANTLKMFYGEKEGKNRAREELTALKERKGRRSNGCTNCQEVETEGHKFQRCKPCWDNVQRTVLYCSGKCQKADWKARHKVICGKPVDSIDEAMKLSSLPKTKVLQNMSASTSSPVSYASQVGPPVNGLKRSPFLAGHIVKLNLNPTTDIIVKIGPGPDDFAKMDFAPFPPLQKVFREVRDKAMTTGDKETAAKLCHFVYWLSKANGHDKTYGWDMEAMVGQMEKEYEMPDLKKVMLEMQGRQGADRLRRP
ncbi:hypothetical protein D9758_012333 [Tetrapyrgos nigripes]|uniref:MYND-type domain-containing protein n=1 Tax=Tetrapyrgos nigripes TaxID=182062 RepID=A0A8H5CM55_9AGAR|nr:hypothetical protein D9758_012333 [Tetrapyrgos nigripes]